jgi:hypothetical protein
MLFVAIAALAASTTATASPPVSIATAAATATSTASIAAATASATATTIASSTSAAAAIAAASPATTATFRTRAGFIHGEVSAIQRVPIKGLRGRIRFFLGGHRYESKPPRTAAHAVEHQIHFLDGAMLREQILQIVFRNVVGEISYEQLCIHLGLLLDLALPGLSRLHTGANSPKPFYSKFHRARRTTLMPRFSPSVKKLQPPTCASQFFRGQPHFPVGRITA